MLCPQEVLCWRLGSQCGGDEVGDLVGPNSGSWQVGKRPPSEGINAGLVGLS
jgi:hypothetical protein